MAKKKSAYSCSACGAQTFQWLGQCPVCGEWNTLEEIASPPASSRNSPAIAGATPLKDAPQDSAKPFSSGIPDLDRVLGGGLAPGSAILAGGEPGIGKSTLMLQVCGGVASQGLKALYASGEESLSQIRNRAERLNLLFPQMMGISASNVEDVIASADKIRPAILIADSAQTFSSPEAEGLPGNVSQTKAVATRLVEECRRLNCALVLIGHVTKDGSLAGPRMLEHLVDTVISLEGDRRQIFRLLRIFKNRFGPTEELLVFKMEQSGLELVHDPSTFFLEDRDPSLSGAALAMAAEGQRALAVETQALAARSYLNIPRRAALGFDVNRLHLLLAVIEKRLKLNFGQLDIFAKVGGGLKIQDPGLDLALVAASLSSYYDFPLPEKAIFWGEVDLNGQIRPAAGHKTRLAHAKRLGFNPVFCPQSVKEPGVQPVGSIMDLQRMLFKRHI